MSPFIEDGWRLDAACRDQDPEIWFPVGRGKAASSQVRRAKLVCHTCPVKEQCLRDALIGGLDHGVFGGLDERERSRLSGKFSLAGMRST